MAAQIANVQKWYRHWAKNSVDYHRVIILNLSIIIYFKVNCELMPHIDHQKILFQNFNIFILPKLISYASIYFLTVRNGSISENVFDIDGNYWDMASFLTAKNLVSIFQMIFDVTYEIPAFIQKHKHKHTLTHTVASNSCVPCRVYTRIVCLIYNKVVTFLA